VSCCPPTVCTCGGPGVFEAAHGSAGARRKRSVRAAIQGGDHARDGPEAEGRPGSAAGGIGPWVWLAWTGLLAAGAGAGAGAHDRRLRCRPTPVAELAGKPVLFLAVWLLSPLARRGGNPPPLALGAWTPAGGELERPGNNQTLRVKWQGRGISRI